MVGVYIYICVCVFVCKQSFANSHQHSCSTLCLTLDKVNVVEKEPTSLCKLLRLCTHPTGT